MNKALSVKECSSEAAASRPAREIYLTLLGPIESKEDASPEVKNFALRFDHCFESLVEKKPDWTLFGVEIGDAAGAILHGLAEVDPEGAYLDLILSKPVVLLGGALRRVCAALKKNNSKAASGPFRHLDLDLAAVDFERMVEAPAIQLWPLEYIIDALYSSYCNSERYPCLESSSNRAKVEAMLEQAGFDLEILRRLARLTDRVDIHMGGLLELCRARQPRLKAVGM